MLMFVKKNWKENFCPWLKFYLWNGAWLTNICDHYKAEGNLHNWSRWANENVDSYHSSSLDKIILNGPFISDCGMKLCVFTYAVCILYILVSFLFSCTAFRALRSVVLQSPLAICRKGEVCELFTYNKNIHTVSEGDRLRTSDILSSGMWKLKCSAFSSN